MIFIMSILDFSDKSLSHVLLLECCCEKRTFMEGRSWNAIQLNRNKWTLVNNFAPTLNPTSDSLFPIESAVAADFNSCAYSQFTFQAKFWAIWATFRRNAVPAQLTSSSAKNTDKTWHFWPMRAQILLLLCSDWSRGSLAKSSYCIVVQRDRT